MESIKQEIINNIYENGEQLITGPILQEVLLDMVDDVNDKVASASAAIPGDLVEKTGSWDDAADWVEQNSSSVVLQPDLDGYATEQWVEDQGYLKEVPEGYATTESLNDLSESVAQDFSNLDIPDTSGLATTESVNQLSESVAQSIADIPAPDLSNYATKPELNEATESVKEWVEAKHYLTSASLSGSVTEETVGFMINDATASVKNWVENQNYATETFVSQAIAEIPGTDLTGYATEQWVEEQGYLKEHQDISGLATTQSVTSLSESVAQDFANLNIPDVSGLATTESVNLLSESVAQTIEDLPQPDLSGYLQTSSYLVDSASFDQRIKDAREEATTAIIGVSEGVVALSASFDQRINSITGSEADLSGYATTQSVNTLSASFAETIDNIPGTDLTGYATEQWVQNQGYLTEHQDISGLATTSSVTALSSSVSSDIQSARTEVSQAISGLGTIVEGMSDQISGLSASFDERINNITGSSSPVDLSGYATTSSVNQLSESLDSTDQYIQQEIQGLQEYMDSANPEGIYQNLDGLMDYVREGSSEDPYEWNGTWKSNLPKYATTESVNTLSASFDQRINNITGSSADLSGYATTASVNQLSESVATDIQNARTEASAGFASVDQGIGVLSASFDQRINSITGSGVDTDLRNFLFGVASQTLTGITGSVTNIYSNIASDTTLGFNAVPDNGKSLGITIHNTGNSSVVVTLPATVTVGGTTYNLINNGVDNSGSMSIPSNEYGDIVVTRNGNNLFVRTSIDVSSISGSSAPVDLSGYATTESVNLLSESIANDVESINNGLDGVSQGIEEVSNSLANYTTTESAEILSASFDSRINNIITGSGVDLSGYATTESVNNLSSSVGTISSSFAETIANIPTGSGGSGNYLPITGGTLTGTLKINASVGVGVDPGGSNCLAVGGSGTETNNAHNSVAVGENCHVSVWNGFAAGRETVIEDDGAFGMATGFRNRTTKMAGYAGGCLSTASGEFATAIGFGAEAAAKGQVVLGAFNEVDRSNGTGSYAVILGNGKSSTWHQDNPGDITRSNGLAIKWDGGIDINYSGSTITLQDKIAELEQGGGSPVDLSGYATTESVNSISQSISQSIVEIANSSELWERGEGSGSIQTVKYSGSIANIASGDNSLAHGSGNQALGVNSHAEGANSVASGRESHAEGVGGTRAIGAGSHAEGMGTTASGSYSHAEGMHTMTRNLAEHALGMYNVTSSKQIFSIGSGYTYGNQITRKNAVSVLTGSSGSASVYVQGIGGYNGQNPQRGVNDLATVINSLSSSQSTPVDLSGYATTESVNALSQSVQQVGDNVSNLSASFDQRIDEIVAASDGIDPSNFAKAPSIVYITDGTYGLSGVNVSASSGITTNWVISNQQWQLENLDLSGFDRIECYFKYSPKVVVLPLDAGTESSDGYYVEKASTLSTNIKTSTQGNVDLSYFSRKWVVVDGTKTKLQVAVNTLTSDYLYKIVGYPKLV